LSLCFRCAHVLILRARPCDSIVDSSCRCTVSVQHTMQTSQPQAKHKCVEGTSRCSTTTHTVNTIYNCVDSTSASNTLNLTTLTSSVKLHKWRHQMLVHVVNTTNTSDNSVNSTNVSTQYQLTNMHCYCRRALIAASTTHIADTMAKNLNCTRCTRQSSIR
jgi:hypothetical protein